MQSLPETRPGEQQEIRLLSDEELRQLAEAEGDDAREWYEYKASLFAEEDARRVRQAQRGLAYECDRFPESSLADLKRRVNLDGVIEFHFGVTLSKRNGAGERRCACPIHPGADNPRNFVVYLSDPDNEHYVCQRCKAGGDVFSAIMQSHGVEFRAAVEILAAYCGVPLPTPGRKTAEPAPRRPGAGVFEYRAGRVAS